MEHNMTTQNVTVGDFFYDIYGYDATLVDFFEVTKVVSDKTIELRKVARKYISDSSVCPTPQAYKSEPFRKRINKYGSFGYSRWDGKPQYISAFGTY